MTDHEDNAAKERMAKRRLPTVPPTDALKKLAATLGEKPGQKNKNKELSFFDLI